MGYYDRTGNNCFFCFFFQLTFFYSSSKLLLLPSEEDTKKVFDLQKICDPTIYLFWHSRFWFSEDLKEARQLLLSIKNHSFPPGVNPMVEISKFENVLKTKYFEATVLLPSDNLIKSNFIRGTLKRKKN